MHAFASRANRDLMAKVLASSEGLELIPNSYCNGEEPKGWEPSTKFSYLHFDNLDSGFLDTFKWYESL